jgi:hypothetical protein
MSTLVRNNNKVTVGLGPTNRLHALSVLVQMTKGLNHAHSTLRFFLSTQFSLFLLFFLLFILLFACTVWYVTKLHVSLYALGLYTLRRVVEMTLYDDHTIIMKLNDVNKMKTIEAKI